MTRLEAWRRLHKLTYSELGRMLGVKGPSTARRWCLPADHHEHRRPAFGSAKALREITGGLIDAANYADPFVTHSGSTVAKEHAHDAA